MKKRLRIVLLLFFYLGLIIWFAQLVMPPVLSDFASGFLTGMSIVFTLIGVAYMGWCLGKRENPYNFDA